MNYDLLIKRARKAIEFAENREIGSSVHKLNINDNIDGLSGLVIVLHPDYNPAQTKQASNTHEPLAQPH